MKNRDRNILLSYILVLMAGLPLIPGTVAEEVEPVTVTEDQALESLRQNWLTARTQYREALKVKKDSIAKEIKAKELAIDNEVDKVTRKRIMGEMKALAQEHEELSDKIRVISAGDVVQLSNTKNKIMAFLTHQ